MKELINQLIADYLPAILSAVITFIVAQIRAKYNKYVDTQAKKEIASATVKYIEQVFTTLHGKDKLAKAKSTMSALLQDKGITIDDTELVVLLEAAVKEMNNQSWATFIEDIKKGGE